MSSNTQKIGAFRLTSLVTGNLIGSGVFLLPVSLAAFGSISILGWMVTSVGAILLALIFAGLSQQLPKTGGPYVYVREAFGYNVGFYVCWGYWMMSWMSNSSLLAGALGYLTMLVGNFDKDTAIIIEIAILLTITSFNLLGIKTTGAGELVVTTLKILPLIMIPVFGLTVIDFDNLMLFNDSGKSVPAAINAVAFLTLWGFVGLETGTVPAGQVTNPKKNVPLATIAGTLIAAIVYVFGTIVILGVLPHADLIASKAPYADAASIIFGGTQWGSFFALAAVVCCIGTLNGWTMIVGRMPQAAAAEGLFPKAFAKTNRYGTPYFGIIISSMLSIPFILMSVQDNLIEQFNFVMEVSVTLILVVYLLCVLAYIKLCCLKGGLKWHRMALGVLALTFVLWALWAASLKMVALSFCVVLLGIPMHIWLRFKKSHLINT